MLEPWEGRICLSFQDLKCWANGPEWTFTIRTMNEWVSEWMCVRGWGRECVSCSGRTQVGERGVKEAPQRIWWHREVLTGGWGSLSRKSTVADALKNRAPCWWTEPQWLGMLVLPIWDRGKGQEAFNPVIWDKGLREGKGNLLCTLDKRGSQ